MEGVRYLYFAATVLYLTLKRSKKLKTVHARTQLKKTTLTDTKKAEVLKILPEKKNEYKKQMILFSVLVAETST